MVLADKSMNQLTPLGSLPTTRYGKRGWKLNGYRAPQGGVCPPRRAHSPAFQSLSGQQLAQTTATRTRWSAAAGSYLRPGVPVRHPNLASRSQEILRSIALGTPPNTTEASCDVVRRSALVGKHRWMRYTRTAECAAYYSNVWAVCGGGELAQSLLEASEHNWLA
jgi:hypothetical protein